MPSNNQQKNHRKNQKRQKKPASSITLSYRVKPYVLGKALTGILKHNPGFDCDKLSKIGKETFMQGLNAYIAAYNIEEISPQAKYILESLSDRIKLDDHDNLLATNRFREDIKQGEPKSHNQKMLESETKAIMDERGYKEKTEIETFVPRNEKEKAFMDAAAIENEQFKQKIAEIERQKKIEKDNDSDKENKKELQEKIAKIQTEKDYLNPHLAKAKAYQKNENDPDFNLLTDDTTKGTEILEEIDDMVKNIINEKRE